MLKSILKNFIYGIIGGSVYINASLLLALLFDNQHYFNFITENYLSQSLAFIGICIGFSLTSISYHFNQCKFPLQVTLHMGGGFIIFFLIAFVSDWIPLSYGLVSTLIYIFIALAIGFAIWGCYYLYYRYQALQINKRIQSLRQNDTK